MLMKPPMRKAALLLHVVASVGWLGSVAAYGVLSVMAAYSSDSALVRSACLAMYVVGWYAVVPLNLLAVVTGLVQALGTPWGLFRYYWVVAKLVLTVLGTGLLLMHQGMLTGQATALMAGGVALPDESLRQLGAQLVWDSGLGLFLLIVLTGLSILKPWGLTRRVLRQQADRGESRPMVESSLPASLRFFITSTIVSLLVFALSHHLHGHHHH